MIITVGWSRVAPCVAGSRWRPRAWIRAVIGPFSTQAIIPAIGASNEITSDEGVGAPNIALARALRGRAH
jgi:hypothetical protein